MYKRQQRFQIVREIRKATAPKVAPAKAATEQGLTAAKRPELVSARTGANCWPLQRLRQQWQRCCAAPHCPSVPSTLLLQALAVGTGQGLALLPDG